MSRLLRIALADDHPLYLEGLQLLLNSTKEATVVATATNGNEALDMMKHTPVDVLLLDLHLPGKNGVEVAEALQKENSPCKIIMLTMQRGGRYVDKLKKLGVKAYVLKSISLEDLLQTIHTVQNGGEYFPEEVNEYNHDEDLRLKSSATVLETPQQQLTDREKEILILVCKEFSSAEIAKKLFISTGTVDTHRKNILQKLGVTNTVGLVKYAIRHGLLED